MMVCSSFCQFVEAISGSVPKWYRFGSAFAEYHSIFATILPETFFFVLAQYPISELVGCYTLQFCIVSKTKLHVS